MPPEFTPSEAELLIASLERYQDYNIEYGTADSCLLYRIATLIEKLTPPAEDG